MSHKILFLCPLLVLILNQKIDIVDYSVTNTNANTPGGACFKRDIGAQYGQHTLAAPHPTYGISSNNRIFQLTVKIYQK